MKLLNFANKKQDLKLQQELIFEQEKKNAKKWATVWEMLYEMDKVCPEVIKPDKKSVPKSKKKTG